ncbi:MAG: SulP family inorganic anion transporter, partial [Actinobacteria bacterium]|nr:SulP family inorganic anion transporter [Actinomycetota bacterium]
EQLVVFVSTIVGVLATDLLVGVGIGIAVKLSIHALNGVPVRSLLKPYLEVVKVDEGKVQINAKGSAVFTNWIPFRREIERLGLVQGNDVVVNLAGTRLVDHSVMEKLHEVAMDFELAGRRLEVVGLDSHRGISAHPRAARKRVILAQRRVSLVAPADAEQAIMARLREWGVGSCTVVPCSRRTADGPPEPAVRMEIVANAEVAARIIDGVQSGIDAMARAEVAVEHIDAVRAPEAAAAGRA